MSSADLAIIGGGFAGATLTTQLLAADGAPRIHLIDRSARFGPGLAFAHAQGARLMNTRANQLSISPDQPDDFVEWLSVFSREVSLARSFPTRPTYGAYLEAKVRRTARVSSPCALALVRDAAVACEIEKSGATISLSSGARLRAGAVVLALGNQAPAAPALYDPNADHADRWRLDPWDGAPLAPVRSCDNVLLVGTGLTMVDVALSLTTTPRTGKIFAISRRGLAPQGHAPEPSLEELSSLDLPPVLSEALAAVRREMRLATARGSPWQSVMDRLRAQAPELWRDLSSDARGRFLRHLRPWWDTQRHRMAPHVASWLAALVSAGAVEIIAGRLTGAVSIQDGVRVSYTPRGSAMVATLDVAHIINCTGPCAQIAASGDPLLRQLLDEGFARPHATGLGFDVTPEGRVIDARGAIHRNVFALGPLTQGAFWEATAVPEIRKCAADIVTHLVKAGTRAKREPLALTRPLDPRR